ncbi:unnamed protein product [Adineta steineri]|uniref:Uncharacterized protein n=1 Tax=Adineta steineri TaxID=433720 RepID=A0A819DUH6_9BILA|nr:unnamed protein product [Adineta steineri]CAF3838098.1 unnamed protein product [Adineta steineri]
MFGFQTLTCLHNIPVVRSSTNKLQDVYAKAKDTSVFIRLPCSVAETVADKSLQIALTIANPLVKPFRGSVRVIDDFAAQKIRQIESKYPAINTPTEDVVHTLSEKTEPVRNAINSVKDTTSSTIQHGKETVSNVASATVNKASGVADSVFSMCGLRAPGYQRRSMDKTTGFMGRTFSPISSFYNYVFQSVQSSLIWFRMLVVFFLLKIKQINDIVLHKIQQKTFLTTLPQRLLILIGGFLDYFVARIRPDDRTLAELKKTKQQSRLSQQPHYVAKRQSFKAEPSITTRQSVVVTQQETVVTRSSHVNVDRHSQPDYSHLTDKEELYARLATGASRPSAYNVDDNTYVTETMDLADSSNDIAQLHAHIKPTDVELLYSRLPSDILSDVDTQEVLTQDQQTLHARLIGADLERQGYQDGE